jgi:hypothetical protein
MGRSVAHRRLALVANVSLSRVYRGRSPFAANVSLREVNQTAFPFPVASLLTHSVRGNLSFFCFALRFAQQTSGEAAGALTVQCFTSWHPSGLRERAVRSTIRGKGRFLRKKGGFAIFSRWSRKNALAGVLESGNGLIIRKT